MYLALVAQHFVTLIQLMYLALVAQHLLVYNCWFVANIELVFHFARHHGSTSLFKPFDFDFFMTIEKSSSVGGAHLKLDSDGPTHVPFSIQLAGLCLRQDLICLTPTL